MKLLLPPLKFFCLSAESEFTTLQPIVSSSWVNVFENLFTENRSGGRGAERKKVNTD